MPAQSCHRVYFALNCLALLLSVLIVFFSTHIRLGEAGLGCTPWPGCYAALSLADGIKGITIPDSEFRLLRSFHRGIASLLGLNVLGILGMALLMRRQYSAVLPALMFVVIVFLSLLGVVTPTRSLPLVTLGNILGGFTLTGLLWAQLVQLRGNRCNARPVFPVLFIALCIHIASGGWASANYTGAACPGLFQCQDTEKLVSAVPGSFNPFRQLTLDSEGQLLADESSSIIQYTHRVLAVMWIFLVIYYYRKTRRGFPHLKKKLLAVVAISLAEFTLGLVNVVTDMPLWPNTLHNLLAVMLLCSVINLLFTEKHSADG